MSDSDDSIRAGDVLSKADEFLKRRRAQLGVAILDAEVPAVEPGDDIPVLTEIVAEEGVLPPAVVVEEVPAPLSSARDPSDGVAAELEAWLDENLPQVVVHVMDGITDKLIQQVHESAREDLLPRLRRALREDAEAGED